MCCFVLLHTDRDGYFVCVCQSVCLHTHTHTIWVGLQNLWSVMLLNQIIFRDTDMTQNLFSHRFVLLTSRFNNNNDDDNNSYYCYCKIWYNRTNGLIFTMQARRPVQLCMFRATTLWAFLCTPAISVQYLEGWFRLLSTQRGLDEVWYMQRVCQL